MYEQPVLFPAISNRESFVSTIQIVDDQTGDLITLTDGSGNPLYAIYLEISPPHHRGGYNGPYPSTGYYGEGGQHATIFATLSNYLSIPDVGTIQVQIPFTVIQTLHGGLTYDVYLRLEDVPNNDARQLLIGKLPVLFGGRGP